jgi:hypothetical protein
MATEDPLRGHILQVGRAEGVLRGVRALEEELDGEALPAIRMLKVRTVTEGMELWETNLRVTAGRLKILIAAEQSSEGQLLAEN